MGKCHLVDVCNITHCAGTTLSEITAGCTVVSAETHKRPVYMLEGPFFQVAPHPRCLWVTITVTPLLTVEQTDNTSLCWF